MLVICRKRDAIDMVATPSGLVMMITVTMMMPVFRKKRDAIDMLAGPVIRNHDDYNEVENYTQ